MRIAVLLTCYNRKATTLECLRRLSACKCPVDVVWAVWLNNDGCTDGTFEAVSSWFPKVNIVQGSGRDFWCGGMRRAWDAAIRSGEEYEGFLWLNDDTILLPDALQVMLERKTEHCIVVGAIRSQDGGTATFGGEDEQGFVSPNGSWQRIRQMNGNVVYVPRSVYDEIGQLDSHWTHAMGDGDYSRTATERGINVWLTPKFVGVCERDRRLLAWQNPTVPLLKRLKHLYSPLGYSEPHLLFRYCLRHDGLMAAAKNYVSCHMKAIAPRIFA